MAPTETKRQTDEPSTDDAVVRYSPSNVNDNIINTDRKPVFPSPFSINMYQRMNTDPYDDLTLLPKLNTVFHIRPEVTWASLTRYHNFVLRGYKYSVHQFALIARFQALPKPHSPLDTDAGICCPARILEIRARDAQNVYIRLYWLYLPSQLPNGRQQYHGRDELVATNHMEIVNAARTIEPFDVVDLRDREDTTESLNLSKYFRQTYHVLTKELSPPQTHCVCSCPVNPNGILVRCTNSQCDILLHGECVEHINVTKLRQQQQQEQPKASTTSLQPPPRLNSEEAPTRGQTTAATDFVVQIIVSKRAHAQGRKRLQCSDVRTGRMWEQDIECLECGTRIR
ncbi:MAG: hypothetical protein Q9178_000706 [Gyalolechia marmorata]